jgi:hypothetical protein
MKKIFIVLVCLFFTGSMFAAELVLVSEDGTKKTKIVDDKTTSLFIVQEMPSIKSIEGLKKLKNLSFVQISFSDLSGIDDETWQSLKEIEYLKLDFCTVLNFDFINFLPNLKAFAFVEGRKIKQLECLDFSNNKELEYFEIHINKIEKLPKIKNLHYNLKNIFLNCNVEEKIDSSFYEKLPSTTTIYVKDEISKYLKNSKAIDNKLYVELMKKYKF